MANRGNNKVVESAELQKLYITQPLQIPSGKRITRHYVNCCLYLKPTEYVLLNWLICYSNGINVVTYSSELLRQFDAASDRAIEIYGKERIEYTTSMTNARIAFISLIEKGMLIKLTRKHNYMINPMMVFTYNHRIFLEKRCQQSYMAILKSADGDNELIKRGLREYCDKVQATYEKEIERTNNINRNRSLEV